MAAQDQRQGAHPSAISSVMPQSRANVPSQSGLNEEPAIQLPSWCKSNKEVKTTLSKTGCPVLDDLAERIHQSGSCSGHQSPSGRAGGSVHRSPIAQAAARVAQASWSTARETLPVGSHSVARPPTLSRSRSFPVASGSRQGVPDVTDSSAFDLQAADEGCSADAVREAADGVTADDPDFKDTVPYLNTVSEGLKNHCLKQLISLKQKLLREFAEVLCLIERKYTLNYAESLSEAREQQTVARYYQTIVDKQRKTIEKMADSLVKWKNRCKLSKYLHAWHKIARNARRERGGAGESDGIDIEYTRTEDTGTKVFERKLSAQLSKAFEQQVLAEECRKYHVGPPCPGHACRGKKQTEKLRFRRIEQLECALDKSKQREQQLLEQKHAAEAKYRQAILRTMNMEGGRGDSPPSECRTATKTTMVCRRLVDSSDSTLPPTRIRRSQSEVRSSRRRTKSRSALSHGAGTQTRHVSCVAPLPPDGWPRNYECVTSKTLRRPRIRVCQERAGPRRTVLTEARGRAAEAAAAAAADGVLDGLAGSTSSVTVLTYKEPRRRTQVTEKWRHLSRN